MDIQVWKLKEFAGEVGEIHINTITGWFNELEKQGIHYVNRQEGDKNDRVFDNLDLEIAKYIKESRGEGMPLKFIYKQISTVFENKLRSVPSGKQEQVFDIAAIKQNFLEDMKDIIATQVQIAVTQELMKLPNPADPVQEKTDRMNAIVAERRVQRRLENEALRLWEQKPLEDRIRRVGFFRKEEDYDKRQRFIADYIDKHYEASLQKEFGLD